MLYRQMGAPEMALAKFYAVMTGSLKLKFGSLEYYQRLVLQAQTEVAETYFLQGKYAEATEYLKRLRKLDSGNLNKVQIQYKLIRCLAALGKDAEIIGEAGDFVTRFEKRPEEPEVRYLLAQALKKTGQSQAALQQVLQLLKSQQSRSAEDVKSWIYWQQRAGNTIGNQLYEEGDYLNALGVYQALANLDTAGEWQLPLWYQMGLIYEKLHHPLRAMEFYGRILARKKELDSNASPGLKTVFDMAQWRTEFINWQNSANLPGGTNAPPRLPSVSASR
jgi:tetratricopeptide (TPR) repeat protein